jgi:UDP-4-amino-4,6-dideoxy-N-acetyl-beta-L-altrosamine transaminase
MILPIPYGKQSIDQTDIDGVIEVLNSDFLTQGPYVSRFETEFATYVGSKYAIAVSNGTAALHLSMLALDLRKKDVVVTTPITFAASANCVRYCQGEVKFIDIDRETYLIDLVLFEEALIADIERKIKGIVAVNFSGRVIDFEALKTICDKYGLWIVEDACHSPGGYFIDSKKMKQFSGNGHFTDLSVFSFHPVKHIACGEGGMITTNNKELYKKLLLLRSHGITRDNSIFNNSIELAGGDNQYPLWYMEMQTLGYNYRLTDIQAALGLSQLKKLNYNIQRRIEIAEKYFNSFKESTFIKRQTGLHEGNALHLYIIEVEDRLGLYNHLRSRNILAQIHYFPCHKMPYYISIGGEVSLSNSENYYEHCISLPIYFSLDDEQVDYVINSVFEYYL